MNTEPKTVSEAYPGFLEAGDLDGKDVTLTIRSVRASNGADKGLDGKPIDKPIVAFEKAHKEWVLNKTNARTIRSLYGNRFSGWEGRKVTSPPLEGAVGLAIGWRLPHKLHS